MKKTVIILMLLTIISKFLGFGRDIILSYFYGASNISDIYLVSLTIPTILFAVIGKGISAGFIPLYTRIESKEGTEKANQFTNNVVNLVLFICTVIFILGMFFTESVVNVIAVGFEGETLKLTIAFTRITLAAVYFIGVNYVYVAFLQIKGIFIIPTLMGLPANLIFIASIFLSSLTTIYIMSIGALIAIFSQFLLLIIYVYKSNYKYQLKLDIKDNNIRKMMILALPAILGTSVAQINILIDQTLASKIAVGGITALNYSSTLSVVIIGIFVLSISTVLYPKISKICAEDKMDELKLVLSGAISAVNVMVMPAIVGLMIFAEPIVELLYGRGEFDTQALLMTANALFFYSIGIIGLSHREILTNTFYSLQDTKTPMVNAAIAMALNIVLNLILSKFLGIGGLALATSISSVICTLLLLISLRKKIGSLGLKTLSFSFMKIVIASVFMGGFSKLAYNFLINITGLTISLFLSALLGGGIYFILIYFLKIKEINNFVLEIKGQIKNKVTNWGGH
ncbi:MAG: murein biosynthesis integral rane protein MurJ [Neobacillus sp.]|nr:murein biosynthesis integral rane protein MurJ [Neobacillus sp.]